MTYEIYLRAYLLHTIVHFNLLKSYPQINYINIICEKTISRVLNLFYHDFVLTLNVAF
jgi:hypothetical protein